MESQLATPQGLAPENTSYPLIHTPYYYYFSLSPRKDQTSFRQPSETTLRTASPEPERNLPPEFHPPFLHIVVSSGYGGDAIGSRFVRGGEILEPGHAGRRVLILPSMPICLRCRRSGVEFGADAGGKMTMTPCRLCGGNGFTPRNVHDRTVLDLFGLSIEMEDDDGQDDETD